MESLKRITDQLKEKFPERVLGVYAFGSRVRGDYGEWSDFDVLVVVKDRDPAIEKDIVGLFVEEELDKGIPYAPLIKDIKAFELEAKHHSPFYTNIMKEGIRLL